MIEIFEVRALGADGRTTMARTSLHLDGRVTMRLRPELLGDAPAIAHHLAEVDEALARELRRLRRVDQAMTLARRTTEVGLALCTITSAWEALREQATDALPWVVGAGLFGLLRWLVPPLVVRVGRGWIERARSRERAEP